VITTSDSRTRVGSFKKVRQRTLFLAGQKKILLSCTPVIGTTIEVENANLKDCYNSENNIKSRKPRRALLKDAHFYAD
jgi:hypothetical protein